MKMMKEGVGCRFYNKKFEYTLAGGFRAPHPDLMPCSALNGSQFSSTAASHESWKDASQNPDSEFAIFPVDR